MDKRALVQLREELVEEKLKCDKVTNELEKLNQQLKKIGIDQNVLDGEAQLISDE